KTISDHSFKTYLKLGFFSVGCGYTCGVTAADFNGDGTQDIASTNHSLNNVAILLGNGDGNFPKPAVSYSVGTAPAGTAVGDFNKDGNQDLISADYTSNTISVLLGLGDGKFQSSVSYNTGITILH
ncbi:MAG: VCBS repeat-containing protein, partial [Candidatus Midichloria sp.]|nr:VCBS repeat-containing protein [Candidatus Midichloria sp.]